MGVISAIPVLRGLQQEDCCELKANLGSTDEFKANFGIVWDCLTIKPNNNKNIVLKIDLITCL